jgi:hypothetical protein
MRIQTCIPNGDPDPEGLERANNEQATGSNLSAIFLGCFLLDPDPKLECMSGYALEMCVRIGICIWSKFWIRICIQNVWLLVSYLHAECTSASGSTNEKWGRIRICAWNVGPDPDPGTN